MNVEKVVDLLMDLATVGFIAWVLVRNLRLLKELAFFKTHAKEYMVQHCNRKTDYEMIVHIFNPDGCMECSVIRDLVYEMRVREAG